jgi:two-component system response regulator YesN
MQVLTDIRMNRAKRLIRKGGVRLSSIATMVGFSDPAYFSRCFKKHTGQTPSAYEIFSQRGADTP